MNVISRWPCLGTCKLHVLEKGNLFKKLSLSLSIPPEVYLPQLSVSTLSLSGTNASGLNGKSSSSTRATVSTGVVGVIRIHGSKFGIRHLTSVTTAPFYRRKPSGYRYTRTWSETVFQSSYFNRQGNKIKYKWCSVANFKYYVLS